MVDNEGLPVLILANKTDLPEADVERVRETYPTYDVVPISALEGTNLDPAYARIVAKFG
jgi:50S ribosomal subunit-associated GTPase HflX